jgi:phosphoribosyl 1,2-cyclic phosphodiesterase
VVRVVTLGSGSRGNATLVEFDDVRILVDAGLSARDLTRRLAAIDVEPDTIRAILLSHEHHDHCRGAERFATRNRVAVGCSPDTLAAMNLHPHHLPAYVPVRGGQSILLGDVRVRPFAVPHDAADPLGFVLARNGCSVGVVTDLGHATTLVKESLRGCSVLVVESNYDEAMLRSGPYPAHLKQRIRDRFGHLSNDQAAAVLRHAATEDTAAVILVHLSEKNNTPALARGAAAGALHEAGRSRVQMRVATQKHPAAAVTL